MINELLIRLVVLSAPISISVAQITYSVLAVIFIKGIYQGEYREFFRNPYLKYMVAVLVVVLLSTILGDNPQKSARNINKVLLMCTFFIGYYMYTRDRLHGVLFWLLVGGGAASAWGLVRFFFKISPPFDRSAGFFASPVSFGNIMAMIAILGTIALILGLYRSPREQIIYMAATLLCLLGLYASITRGAMIAYLAPLVLIILIVFRARGVVLSFGILLMALLAVLAVPQMRGRLMETIFYWNDPNTSFGWRFVLWRESWQVFLDNWFFGVGFGNLRREYLIFLENPGGSAAHAHNNILQILAEHGIAGFIAICALFVRLVAEQVAGVVRKNVFALMGLSLSAVFFVMGLSEYSMFDSEICMLFWFMSGMLIKGQEG